MSQKLGDYLSPDSIRLKQSVSSKKRALEILSEGLASSSGALALTDVFEALLGRERLGTTAIGDGIAIPHGRCKLAQHASVVLLKLEEGVDYEAPDGQPVDLMFALLAPEEHAQEHLDLLSGIASLCSDPEFVSELRQQTSAEGLLKILNKWEQD